MVKFSFVLYYVDYSCPLLGIFLNLPQSIRIVVSCWKLFFYMKCKPFKVIGRESMETTALYAYILPPRPYLRVKHIGARWFCYVLCGYSFNSIEYILRALKKEGGGGGVP